MKRPLEGSISRSSHLFAEKNQSAVLLRLIKLARSFTLHTDETDLPIRRRCVSGVSCHFAASEKTAQILIARNRPYIIRNSHLR